MEALSSAAAAFQAQKISLRQSRAPSENTQGSKLGGHAAATNSKAHPDNLVKMLAGAALTGQQSNTLRGKNTPKQGQFMGSSFAGPGFQLPPTPEALPLPSSSLLQRFRQQ